MSTNSNPGNIYENLWKAQKSIRQKEPENISRRLFLMSHGERVDFTFGTWIAHCFDENGTYERRDLNMPETLFERSQGPTAYLKDTPLTNLGVYQAKLVGEGFKSEKMDIAYAYSSPALRCLQTCDSFLRGCNKHDSIKIKIEPGLFEGGLFYEDSFPNFMTAEELIAAGFNIDTSYEPFVKEADLKLIEDCEEYYKRSNFVAKSALNAHPTDNILLVGHSATLEVCSRELLGKEPRKCNEFVEVVKKIPNCGLIQVGKLDDEKWKILEFQLPPITHVENPSFDHKDLSIDETE